MAGPRLSGLLDVVSGMRYIAILPFLFGWYTNVPRIIYASLPIMQSRWDFFVWIPVSMLTSISLAR